MLLPEGSSREFEEVGAGGSGQSSLTSKGALVARLCLVVPAGRTKLSSVCLGEGFFGPTRFSFLWLCCVGTKLDELLGLFPRLLFNSPGSFKLWTFGFLEFVAFARRASERALRAAIVGNLVRVASVFPTIGV